MHTLFVCAGRQPAQPERHTNIHAFWLPKSNQIHLINFTQKDFKISDLLVCENVKIWNEFCQKDQIIQLKNGVLPECVCCSENVLLLVQWIFMKKNLSGHEVFDMQVWCYPALFPGLAVGYTFSGSQTGSPLTLSNNNQVRLISLLL